MPTGSLVIVCCLPLAPIPQLTHPYFSITFGPRSLPVCSILFPALMLVIFNIHVNDSSPTMALTYFNSLPSQSFEMEHY